ncbi:MAG: tetratricopeptide repeat protein [Verrucomicrobiae bacterium]|nr:tetratricopeptide repeat protein [Verrucomicrobiae bacterium]
MRIPGSLSLLVGLLTVAMAAPAQTSRSRRDRDGAVEAAPASRAPTTFAPLPVEHPLSGIWNDPDFVRRLIGSYGFLSEAEPRMTAEEQALLRDRIVPLLQEDPLKAVEPLEALIQPSGSAVFEYTLGTVYFQNEQFGQAVRYYEQALAKFPDYRRAQRNLALALVRDGRYSEAIRPLARTLALGGWDGRILGLLGFAYLNESRFASAAGAYSQATIFEPDNVDYKLGLVKAWIGLNQFDAAVAMLDELIQQFPERESLWSLQANVFIQQERSDAAIVNLEILRQLGHAGGAQLALLGDLYLMREHADLALAVYLEAVAKDGAATASRGLRPAGILVSRGAWEPARTLIAAIREAGELEGDNALTLLKLEARVAVGTGNTEEGIAMLEEIARRNPLDGDVLLLAGDVLARNGQAEKAAFRYESAARIEGFEADALLKHAQLKVQQQKYAEAVEMLRRAQRIRPRDNVARYLERVEQVAARARS